MGKPEHQDFTGDPQCGTGRYEPHETCANMTTPAFGALRHGFPAESPTEHPPWSQGRSSTTAAATADWGAVGRSPAFPRPPVGVRLGGEAGECLAGVARADA